MNIAKQSFVLLGDRVIGQQRLDTTPQTMALAHAADREPGIALTPGKFSTLGNFLTPGNVLAAVVAHQNGMTRLNACRCLARHVVDYHPDGMYNAPAIRPSFLSNKNDQLY